VVTAQFLSGYRGAIGDNALLPANSDDFKRLLDACLFEKALYELMYEMNNRPTWVRIPLAGIMAMVA
jgi:maltose alpha-D-glucosyltransferase/alpha-amylase